MMKTGCRPRMRTRRQPMLNWIVVYVVEVTIKIPFVKDRVLPKAALPYVAVAMLLSGLRNGKRSTIVSSQRLCELDLHATNSLGVLLIARRQRPEKVNVVWQDNGGINVKRHVVLDCRDGLAQPLHVFPVGKQWLPLIRHNGFVELFLQNKRKTGRNGVAHFSEGAFRWLPRPN